MVKGSLFIFADSPDLMGSDPAYVGQALGIALVHSVEREVAEDVADWVRRTMEYCHREGIFGEVLSYFEHSISGNTEEGIFMELQQHLPERAVSRMEHALAQVRGDKGISAGSAAELVALGGILAQMREGNTTGILAYATLKGLIREEDMRQAGLSREELDGYQSFIRSSQGVDLNTITREDMRGVIERHRFVSQLVEGMRRNYGDIHPLVRGHDRMFFEGARDIAEQEAGFESILQEMEKFLNERH